LAKIAVELDHALARRKEDGTAGQTTPRVIAKGDGWSVADVVCTCGPADQPYEERHSRDTIAIVQAGSFEYRSAAGRGLMTAGSLMLGSHGQSFECTHRHGEGDRCVSFWYAPDYFERLAADAGARRSERRFKVASLPALRPLSRLVTHAGLGIYRAATIPWEEFAVTLAARTVRLASGVSIREDAPPLNAEARVARAVRMIDRHPEAALTLAQLARVSGLSPYHFLRTFKSLIGVTPHQYVLRARLRDAAARLALEPSKVLDVALDCGFGDVSNFNRAFRAEFGESPLAFRKALRGGASEGATIVAHLAAG
jgi:AraC-like DNA-binding protein